MLWEAKNDRDGFAVQAAIDRGFDPPDWWLEEPMVDDRGQFFLVAFRELGTTRSFGMSIGPIPWHHVVQYAQMKNLDEEATELFVAVISKMDAGYLNWHYAEMRKKS